MEVLESTSPDSAVSGGCESLDNDAVVTEEEYVGWDTRWLDD